MAEQLSARLARISTEAEAMANALADRRSQHDYGDAERRAWYQWNGLYWWVREILSGAEEAREFLREHSEMDIEL